MERITLNRASIAGATRSLGRVMAHFPNFGIRLRSHGVHHFEIKAMLTCAFLSLAALASVGITASHPVGAFTKYLLGSLAIGFVPGLLLVVVCIHQVRLGLLEVLALSIAISMSLAGPYTIFSFLFHIPVSTMAVALPIVCAAVALACAGYSRTTAAPKARVYAVNLDLLVIALMVLTALIIYVTAPTKPIHLTEDVLQTALIKRVAVTPDPSIYNTFCCPGALYSYPFPSLHYFIAMITVASDLDPIFVYQKSRFFWCLASILAFFAATKMFFRSNVLAYFATLVGVVFIFNGTLALVPGFHWGQLTPTTHNSDVAMNALLPLAIMALLHFVDARQRSATVFFGAFNALLFLTIGLAHPREIIQLMVYIGIFIVVFLVVRRDRERAVRSAVLLGLIIAVFGSYYLWLKGVQDVTSEIVASRLNEKLEAIKDFGFLDWFSPAVNTEHFVAVLPTVFFMLFPTLLITAIATVYSFRRRPYVVAAGMTILVFLLIIEFPLFAAPFVLATYHEILISPVRNFVFFLYVLGGGAIYALYRIAAGRSAIRLLAVIAISGLAGSIAGYANATLLKHSGIFILALILGFAALLGWITLRRKGVDPAPYERRSHSPVVAIANGRRIRLLAALCAVVPAALLSKVPTESPATALRRVNVWTTPDKALNAFYQDQLVALTRRGHRKLDEQGCLERRDETVLLPQFQATIEFPAVRTCVPSLNYVMWLRENVAKNDVLALNILNKWWHQPFVDSRSTFWSYQFIDSWRLFDRYFTVGRKASVERGEQPYFGPSESSDERLAALEALDVTHVILDPDVYDDVIRQYRSDHAHYSVLYDDNHWAVIAVR